MGCLPAAAVVAVALPKSRPMDDAKELYHGLREAADLFDCVIVGGDTSTWDGKLVVSVTILGRSAGIRPVTRGGALPGNGIYVTGPLGGSVLGRHLSFEPRIALGRKWAPAATAMIDLSDGLSRDLAHVCRMSGVGGVIESRLLPVHPDAVELSRRDGVSALDHALNDGEDYELLFTCAAEIDGAIRIGRTTEKPGIFLEDENANRITLAPRGWEHHIGRL